VVYASATSQRSETVGPCISKVIDNVQTLNHFRLLSFTEPAIDRFAQLKALKLGVRRMDLRIAAIALENGGTLVTRNVRDFQGVPGLNIENWTI
jgi:tRNA(fMet)-specific endonuclease VapC